MIVWEQRQDILFGRLRDWGCAMITESRGHRRGWRLETLMPTGERIEIHADIELLKTIAEQELQAFLNRAGLTLKYNAVTA